jgi:hypothetical protein
MINEIQYGIFQAPTFDDEPFEHLVCVKDMFLLATILDKNKLLPKGLTINDFNDYQVEHSFHWFWVEVFPNYNKEKQVQLFQTKTIFNDIIDKKLQHKSLKRWVHILNNYQREMMDLDIYNIVASVQPREYLSICGVYHKYESILSNKNLKQLYFIAASQVFIKKLGSNSTLSKLRKLSKLWSMFMQKAELILKLPQFKELIKQFRPSSRKAITEVVKKINAFDFVPLTTQYFIITSCFNIVAKVAEKERTGDLLICIVLAAIDNEHFLESFILLSSFVINNSSFSAMMDPSTIEIWNKISNIIYNCLNFDQQFLHQILNVINQLKQFTKERESPMKKAISVPNMSKL